MLSNAQQKFVNSLHQKKYRKIHQAFIVEGRKNVDELLKSDFVVQSLFSTKSISEKLDSITTIVSENELNKVSTLKISDSVLAIVKQKGNLSPILQKNELTIVLDNINDPGNLGTIIRTADWFGIKNIICSDSTVDFYNPKVIMSTMGSFGRVNLFYTDLKKYLIENSEIPVFGAFLEGVPVKTLKDFKGGFLLMGSETHGISQDLTECITKKITIPRIGGAESLNVAISTAILIDNLINFK